MNVEGLRLTRLKRRTRVFDGHFFLVVVDAKKHSAVIQGIEFSIVIHRRNDLQSISIDLRSTFASDQMFFVRTNPFLTRIFPMRLTFRIDQFDLRDRAVRRTLVETTSTYVIEMPFDLFRRFRRHVEDQTNVVGLTEILQFGGERIVSTGFETLRKVS